MVISLVGAGYVGVHAITKNPCSVPKTWSIGSVDSRFGISNDTVKSYGLEATNSWNKHYAENDLFSYQESGGDITIIFKYDERQQTTIANENLKSTIEEEKEALHDLKQTLTSLQSEYDALEKSVRTQTGLYNTKLTKHNKEVEYWNKEGGAPSDVYVRLQREASSLETERASLNASIRKLNTLAETIRTYGKDHNLVVGTINEKIQTLNKTAAREFEEGTYDPSTKTITIYEYGSILALKRVLIHEFGHALSIDHIEDNEQAIMYPINQGKNLELTGEDISSLVDTCREKTFKDIASSLRIMYGDISHLVGSSLSDTAVQAEQSSQDDEGK